MVESRFGAMTAELLDFQIVKLVLSYLYQYKLIWFVMIQLNDTIRVSD